MQVRVLWYFKVGGEDLLKLYIDPTPNPSGVYPNPKLQPFRGGIELDEAQSEMFLKYKGCVRVVSQNPVVIEPNEETWEHWKEVDVNDGTHPTETEQIRADIDYIALMTGVEL